MSQELEKEEVEKTEEPADIQELEGPTLYGKTSILVRMKGWQKADLEAEAKKQNRSVNNFVLTMLGQRRRWKDRDPETGKHPE